MIWGAVADANPELPKVKILRPDVPDLWRLQAQKGVFVRAMVPLDQVYQLDRIVFPIGSASTQTSRSRIYPNRRSRLEDLIGRYLKRARRTAMSLDEILAFNQSFVPNYDKEQERRRYEDHKLMWIKGFAEAAFLKGHLRIIRAGRRRAKVLGLNYLTNVSISSPRRP
jgi:hypothetical protein